MDVDWTGIFIYTMLFWLVFRLGQVRGRMELMREILARPEEITRIVNKYRVKDEDSGNEETLEVERHGDLVYVYTKSGEFLAQAATLQECLTRIEQRFPDRRFRGHLSKEQADRLGVTAK